MIDIHNHVIYEFDDGPRSLDESLALLKSAAEQGITDVFATSHFNEIVNKKLEDDYFAKLKILREKVQETNIPVRLYPGSEMFFHHYIHQTLRKIRVGTLAESNCYVLMEFPLYLMPVGVEDTLFNLRMDGFIPIIAHPERYSSLHNKPEKILNFIRHGGLLQVNVGSALGSFGRKCQKIAMWLLENQYVHFLASDAHLPNGRGFRLAEAAEELEKDLDKSYIEQIVRENPQKIIDNQTMEAFTLPEEEPQKSFFEQVRKKLKLI
jgi:protein-tyrosine phosphatase